MKKLFYLSLIIILFCGCEKKMLCDCERKNEPLELGRTLSKFVVVELKNEDLINNIYVVPDDTKTYNEFISMIPNTLDYNQSPFIHITGNNYLVNWNWLLSYNFFDSLDDHYVISNKWDEWYEVDVIKEEKINKKLIKKIKVIFAHTINDYLKNKNLDIIIEENFIDNLDRYNKSFDIITEEIWSNYTQEEKEHYLEKFESYNENYNNAKEALKYLLSEKDSNKYFAYPKYRWQ